MVQKNKSKEIGEIMSCITLFTLSKNLGITRLLARVVSYVKLMSRKLTKLVPKQCDITKLKALVQKFVYLHYGFQFQKVRTEPAHEIMALFVLRKLILQTRMGSHPVGLDVWCLVGPFVYFHTSCVRTAKALVRLRGPPM